jgi:hypothetical protein
MFTQKKHREENKTKTRNPAICSEEASRVYLAKHLHHSAPRLARNLQVSVQFV